MSIDLPLHQMTLADKLEAMELLWADLSRTPGDLPSPAWHAEVLAERRRQAERGELKFVDWEVALNGLRSELRGNSPR